MKPILRVLVPLSVSLLSLLPLSGCDSNSGDDRLAAADATRGGALYDKWWVVAELSKPVTDHPLWSARPDLAANKRSGADTHRCKECHGWDYRGASGAYATGSHRTGIAGIFETALDGEGLFALLSGAADGTANGHGYLDLGLSEQDLWDLTKFVLEGTLDTNLVIADGAFAGNSELGRPLYEQRIAGAPACSTCHGADGLTPPGDDAAFEDFPGLIANENPWELIHKIRFGQPGTVMPRAYGKLTASELADLGAYIGTLPEEQ